MYSSAQESVHQIHSSNTADVALHVLCTAANTSSPLEEVRLDRLVTSVLDIDEMEAERLEVLSGGKSTVPFRTPRRFHETLVWAIGELQLSQFFCSSTQGHDHRSICPSAYDERRGQHHPGEMAAWRANFRALSPERQMIAATIVWLYRSGPDSIWLRRVPCNWRAIDALRYMADAGCLAIWLRLIARFPGW
ncbi:hypothetical protein [Burkholderia lata]|uniref:Uncharacterized protein n=1 Tax=Burkholderia lata (strain ATCC 17760 / DSM 23089 / LMG 22485 / NCIMB 9086 / R18194 / 383) TaxID=482957 RepID=Q39GA2_BURL3|nr:hypothetical protein [Burkholderia lata]ABB08514.1 hypothetical protein Bcep18194_A4919 [Burkholderia lata]